VFNFNQNFENDESFSKQYKSQFETQEERFVEGRLFKILVIVFGVILVSHLLFLLIVILVQITKYQVELKQIILSMRA